MRGFLLAVRFLCELALMAVLAVIGAGIATATPARVALGVLGAGLGIAIWAAFIAPKARRRLPDPARLVVELILFGGSAIGLAVVGQPVVAAVYGVIAVLQAILVRPFAKDA